MQQPYAKRKRVAKAASEILSEADFDAMVQELKTYDEQREQVIKRSRDIQKLSKQAIFSLHRAKDDEAAARLSAAEAAATELLPLIAQSPTLRSGSFSSAMEEFAEALLLRIYLREGRVPARGEVGHASIEEYLGGVLDFTGELNRVAIARATVRDKAAVQAARHLVGVLQGQFLRFDLRNSSLRRKYDALKYTLKKLESTIYELSLTEHGLLTKLEDAPEVETGGGVDAGNDNDL